MRDIDFDAISEKDIFVEARDRLQIAIDKDSRNRQRAKEAIRFRWGDQWPQKGATSLNNESSDIQLSINFTDTMAQRIINNMRQQRPRGKCHPVGDGANNETAELINGIGRHVEYRSEAGIAYDTAADFAVTNGWGWCRMRAEYVSGDSFQRDIRIDPIWNIFAVYCDPSAIMPTACDMNWALISIKQKRIEYHRQHPNDPPIQWQSDADSKFDWDTKDEIRLAEYFRIRQISKTLYLLRDGAGNENAVFEDELPDEPTMKAAKIKILDKRQSSKRQVEWFMLNGTKVIEREILPGEYIPLIRCLGNQVDNDGEIMRKGWVENVMDPQRMINYGEVAKIRRLALTPQAPWVMAEGQADGHPEWTSSNVTAHPVLFYKPQTQNTGQGEVPIPPPQRQPPAQLEAGFAEFTEGMRSNFLVMAGMPNEPGQDTRGQVVSGIAQQRRDKTSDQAHFQYYDYQTLMIAHVWRIMLSWIPYYINEPGRMQRIIGEDSVPKMVKLNDDHAEEKLRNDLSIGRYDVVMDTGPGYETKREEGAENLINLLSIGPLAEIVAKVGPDLVFRAIDHPYMQELADRIQALTPDGLKDVMEQLPERAKAVVQSLANENAQLKQQLQAAQSGLTKEHLAATVKAHDVEVTNETRRMDTISRDRTAIEIAKIKEHGAQGREEIRGAVTLLDTHTQAHHDMKQLIEAGKQAERSDNGLGSGE